ncbi:alanine racemase [Spirulina major]|uniref:alanine racemase n=1 Tax=Spirulina major TaxID=270636 RepID=UPI000932B936|nr:alanine racemase [Spirulina major]
MVKQQLNSPQQIGTAQQRAWVEIDLTALGHNVQQLFAHLAPGAILMAVVKADAYGHGAVPVAEVLVSLGVQRLAVATPQEGIALRQGGIHVPILVFGAIYTPAEIEAIAHHHLEPTLCTPHQAALFADTLTPRGTTLPVHLNIDTGMSRLGTRWTDALSLVQAVHELPSLHLASVYSHFATADDPDPQFMEIQRDRFEAVLTELRNHGLYPPMVHLANSAGTLGDRALHYDGVRIGLSLYGLYPAPHLSPTLTLRPVMAVKARVTQVKSIPPQTGVSYGHRYVSDRPLRLAVVSIGYADGVPRLLTHKMQVLIRGQRVPQIGAITMDQLMVDVTELPDVQPGDCVTLLGQDGSEQITADDWANAIGTISWEILCGFKPRLPRVYLH